MNLLVPPSFTPVKGEPDRPPASPVRRWDSGWNRRGADERKPKPCRPKGDRTEWPTKNSESARQRILGAENKPQRETLLRQTH